MEAGSADDERGIGVGSEEVPAENNRTQDAEHTDNAARTTAAATNRTEMLRTFANCKTKAAFLIPAISGVRTMASTTRQMI